jgi:hypothetical protein
MAIGTITTIMAIGGSARWSWCRGAGTITITTTTIITASIGIDRLGSELTKARRGISPAALLA